MLHLGEITYWQDSRDSSMRFHARDDWQDGYKLYLFNPNRISDLKVDGTGSCFRFSDNHRDRREGNSFMRCNSTVAEIQASHDTAYASNFVTLPFCPKNNPLKTPVDVTIDVEDIAYFCEYDAPHELGLDDPAPFVWLVYCRKAFKRVEQLVAYTLDQAEDVVETGTTTTTSTTTTTEARTTQDT